MTLAPDIANEQRVLILAPTGKDGAMMLAVLLHGGLHAKECSGLDEFVREIEVGAGVAVVAEEALDEAGRTRLAELIACQPSWSDLPVILVSRPGADSQVLSLALEKLGNVTVLERPMRVAAIVTSVRAALRARSRQYQVRDALEERTRAAAVQALLAAIVASSDDAIISKTLEGIILTWNAGAERLFGYTAEEAIGQPVTMLIPPDRLDEDAAAVERLRQGERIDHFETVRLTKDGRRRDISLTVSPIRDVNGRVIGASKVGRDITDRKLAEQALREADRRKDEFLAMLAHELRNPLAPIQNSLHLLRLSSGPDDNGGAALDILERQVKHMVRLVDDLLEVSRITRGRVELRCEPTDLADVVQAAVESSAPAIEAGAHGLSVAVEGGSLVVNGDPVRLTQVLSNLLNNAAKYMERGGQVFVHARREGSEAVIAVRDTGVGLTAEMLDRVFDLFTQVDRRAGRMPGGLGIGLTLARSLTEAHGGTLRAASEGLGKGTEFVVRLPLVADVVQEAAGGRPVPGVPAGGLAARRVLIVDDNADGGESIGLLLRRLGAETRVLRSGADALELVRWWCPSAVLLDIGMPGMDGYEVARRIRRMPGMADVLLIAVSGWGRESDRRESAAAGFDHHLIKPADLGELHRILSSREQPDGIPVVGR